MGLTQSPADEQFLLEFDAGLIPPSDFGHRAHLRLACGYLAKYGAKLALDQFRQALQRFLVRNAIPASKYHETMTQAWLSLVQSASEQAGSWQSSAEFLKDNPALLDPRLIRRFYSDELLASEEAKAAFVHPDLAASLSFPV